MTMSRWAWVLALAVLVACSRSEPPSTGTGAGDPPRDAVAKARPGQLPVEIKDEDDSDEDGDPYFDFDLEPMDPNEFEIDADASAYFGYAPMKVYFGAVALNGTPPFTITWNFKDGTPKVTGDRVYHIFAKETGQHHVEVTGKDAEGETSRMHLGMVILTREEYAFRAGVDPESLPDRAELLEEPPSTVVANPASGQPAPQGSAAPPGAPAG